MYLDQNYLCKYSTTVTNDSFITKGTVAQLAGHYGVVCALTEYGPECFGGSLFAGVYDPDGDGVSGLADAFPFNAATAVDADNDGLADGWLQPNSFGCATTDASCNGLALDNDRQVINITAPSNALYNSSFTFVANASTGLPITLSSSGGCSVSGNTVTMTSGTTACTLTFSQAGNATYYPVTATKIIAANKLNQAISITQAAPETAPYASSFTVAATASSGLAVTLSAGGSCSLSGNTLTMTSGTAPCTVTYNQYGDSNYNPAAFLKSLTSLSVFSLNGVYKGSSIHENNGEQ